MTKVKDKELLESLNGMDYNKLLSMNEDEFDKWVMSFAGIEMTWELGHKLEVFIGRYYDIHNDYDDKTTTLNKDFELANALGLTEEDFEKEYETIENIISLLNEDNYNITKPKNLVKHQSFVGIPDLGSPRLIELHNEFNIQNFEQLSKAISMLHGPKLYDANEDWLVKQDNPSLNDCVCFKEDADLLDDSDINNAEFRLDMGYVPHKEWMIRHVKIVLALARVYLSEPLKYYKAYISLHREVLKKIDLNKDLIKQLIHTKDIHIETMLLVIIDALEQGYKNADLGLGETKNG